MVKRFNFVAFLFALAAAAVAAIGGGWYIRTWGLPTAWILAAFAAILVIVVVLVGLIAIAARSTKDNVWPEFAAAAVGLVLGIGLTILIMKANIGWRDAGIGLAYFGSVIGLAVAAGVAGRKPGDPAA